MRGDLMGSGQQKQSIHKSLLSKPLTGRGQPFHYQLQKQLIKSLPVLISVRPPGSPHPRMHLFFGSRGVLGLYLFPEVINHYLAHFYQCMCRACSPVCCCVPWLSSVRVPRPWGDSGLYCTTQETFHVGLT